MSHPHHHGGARALLSKEEQQGSSNDRGGGGSSGKHDGSGGGNDSGGGGSSGKRGSGSGSGTRDSSGQEHAANGSVDFAPDCPLDASACDAIAELLLALHKLHVDGMASKPVLEFLHVSKARVYYPYPKPLTQT